MDNNKEKMPLKGPSSSRVVEKLAQELDKKVGISPPVDLHPLLIDHVVQKIMAFLDLVKGLKSARLVCKLWRVEGQRQILIKSCLSPKLKSITKELTETELLNFLSLAKPSEMFKLMCGNKDILNIIQKFPKLTERVRELKYETDAPDELWKLVEAIDKLPNLRILDTNDPHHFSVYRGTWNRSLIARNSEVFRFYNQLESLEEIRIDFPFSPNDHDILVELGNRLKNVSKITLINPKLETLVLIASEASEWPLNNITLKFKSFPRQFHQYFSSIRQFFIKNKNTLKFLNIEVSENLTSQKPWEDDWLIPVDFPVLETMVIGKYNIWSLLTIALRLPRLKKLVLPDAPQWIDEKIYRWEKHSLARGRKLQSLSIQQVELSYETACSSFTVLNGSLWPNLKSLTLNLNNTFLENVFPCWDELENPELNSQLDISTEIISFQDWLMRGVKCSVDYEKGTVIINDSDFNSSPASKLVDLKNLKSLTLHLPSSSWVLGDFLVYNCLQFMTNLQSLRFGGQTVISAEALSVLKNKLGDIVSFLDN